MKAKIIGSESPLVGKILINGSKNSALPILAATLLTAERVQLANIPNIDDIAYMIKLLEDLGANVNYNVNNSGSNHQLSVQCKEILTVHPCQKLTNKFRASFVLLGPLLTRFGKASIGLPGGCNIGARSVDLHLAAFEKMGAKIVMHKASGYIEAYGKLHGAIIKFPKTSVGATENVLMAAILATGTTVIMNAAVEPEVIDLTKFLLSLGARISGVGTKKLVIEGVQKLENNNSSPLLQQYSIMPDRIEAATYATIAIATGGSLELVGIKKKQLGAAICKKLTAVGGKVAQRKRNNNASSSVVVSRRPIDSSVKPTTISTNPYPSFPTDLQPQFTALLCLAKSACSIVQENVFESRFQHVQELAKLGANIVYLNHRPNAIMINGSNHEESVGVVVGGGLHGNTVVAHDLRGAAALVLAGLVAKGETVIQDVEHLLRGYEGMDRKLNACGANIQLVL